MNELTTSSIFEAIKHIDENGHEYWEARELQKVLGYTEWRKFTGVIKKAIVACETSNNDSSYHFVQVDKMIDLAKSARRKITDYHLTRYACYLIAQNGDSKKKVIALAQTYFAIQTRKQKLLEQEYILLTEDQK